MAVVKRKLSDEVIEEIRRMTKAGKIKKGDKLPDHTTFAKQLNVSRNTLREAMNTLELLGVVEQRSGRGTVVKDTSPFHLMEFFNLPEMGGDNALNELLDAREVIELGAMKFIFTNITHQDMEDLRVIFRQMESALKQSRHEEYARKDLEFHRRLIESSHNRFLLQTFEHIRGFTQQFITEGYKLRPGIRESSLDEHRQILEALSAGDQESAYRCMEGHIRRRKNNFKKNTASNN